VVKAVAEAVRIGRESKASVEISHHKACGRPNWGKVNDTLRLIEAASKEGAKVGFDVYPYTAGSTSLDTVLPPWVRDGGKPSIMRHLRDSGSRLRIAEELRKPSDEWENSAAEDGWESIVLVDFQTRANKGFENRSVASIAEELGKPPEDVVMDLIVEEDSMVSAIFHDISEEDLVRVISHPLACIGSDGMAMSPHGPFRGSCEHPRSYGTFPRAIRRYSIDKGLFPLEEAIRKMTALPAARLGLANRGVLASGMAADVVVFDPERIADAATFEDPHRYPEGIEYVLVNGAVTVQEGKHTTERAGLVLRHMPSVA
jgi:N-acyl-D-amino-acid deacylase